ncbi:hypothetical protein BD770DRAFT_401523 [Pilaira anomala]|nr:hypothetical protein BD770DRAFT_401523 [Pilaira anomala]
MFFFCSFPQIQKTMSSSDIVNRSNERNTIILLKKSCPDCDKLYQSNQKAVNHIVAIHQKKKWNVFPHW